MTYSAEVLADSPLAYYRLGDTLTVAPAVIATSASSSFSTEPPGNAFDGNGGTFWTTNGVSSGWLRAQFAAAFACTTYTIRRRDDIPARNPKNWTFEGSNDGTTWTVLDTQTGITWPTSGETKSFTFTNTTAYSYYRLNITANNGDTYLSVAELKMFPRLVADASGNGHGGAPAAGITFGVTGALVGDSDTAASFNGTSGKVDVDYGSWMNQANITVEAWIKTTTSAVEAVWDRDKSNTSPRVFQFRINAGKVEFLLIGASVVTATSVASVNNGAWRHIAATYDGAAIKIYIDGNLDKTISTTVALPQNTAYMSLGVNTSSGDNAWFNGTLDEAAYYGTALAASRIYAHYAAGAAAGPAILSGVWGLVS